MVYHMGMKLQYLNYKLPLKKVEDGHGYFGTLAQTENKELVQCHICGELVANLGHHAWIRHGVKAKEYRAAYQLGARTPLCSDMFTEKCQKQKLEAWNALSEEERAERLEVLRKAREKAIRTGNRATLEALNRRGMCPDQLLKYISDLAKKLGKSPTFKEFEAEYNGKYVGAINRTFGSWNGAKHMAGFKPCKSGSDTPHNKSPYTNEMLIEYLQSFYKEKGYAPTHADWRRGFLPSYDLYKHRFGGIGRARELAGIK